MLRFQRVLLLELLLIFQGVLSVVTAVVFAGVTLRLVYLGDGVGLEFLAELVPKLMPIAVSHSLPFAWLAAIALVLGRMVSDKEVTALRAAGLHLRTLVFPVIALGVVVALASTLFNTYTVPAAQRDLRAGVRRYVGIFLSSLKNVDRRVTLENGRFSFSRFEEGAFWDIELDRRRKSGDLEFKIIARKATIRKPPEEEAQDKLDFFFEDAYVIRPTGSGDPSIEHRGANSSLQMGRVERVGASVLFNEFFGTQRFVERPKDMMLPDLLYAAERGGVWRGSRARVLTALHGRFSSGLAPLVFGIFATGMALLVPADGRRVRHFLLCFLPPLLIYFPLFVAGPALGRKEVMPPWLVMWLPILVVAGLGSILLFLAYRK